MSAISRGEDMFDLASADEMETARVESIPLSDYLREKIAEARRLHADEAAAAAEVRRQIALYEVHKANPATSPEAVYDTTAMVAATAALVAASERESAAMRVVAVLVLGDVERAERVPV